MTPLKLLQALLTTDQLAVAENAVLEFEASHPEHQWIPVGRPNNRGTIEAATDPGRSIVERLTNSIDAVLEREHNSHMGIPECISPRDAATAWLHVPAASSGGLSKLTRKEREVLAKSVATITIDDGEGKDSRAITIEDRGTGIKPVDIGKTILSLNESNKARKRYVAGAYGQGGSSTFAVSDLSLITSRHNDGVASVTVIRFMEPPLNEDKNGFYAYLVSEKGIPYVVDVADLSTIMPEAGTIVKHFGYDLTQYTSTRGERSVYGLLNRVMFDPVLPIFMCNKSVSAKGSNRTIRGSRVGLNALAGQQNEESVSDAGDDDDATEDKTKVVHSIQMYYIELSGYGRIGIEYWVLQPPTKSNKQPTSSYVSANRPIVMTLLGQNQAEFPISIVRKDAQLPFLAFRLVGHISCDYLSTRAKSLLFVSNREEARKGHLSDQIQNEFLRALKSDDILTDLNEKAKEASLRNQDKSAEAEVRAEVAKLLKVHGLSFSDSPGVVGGGLTNSDEGSPPPPPSRPRSPLTAIEVRSPPTYIKIVWPAEKSIKMYPGQRKYIRLETDAPANIHDPADPKSSRINIIVTGPGSVQSTTALSNGRMRGIMDCGQNETVGSTGKFRVELSIPGKPTLCDERATEIVQPPPAKPAQQKRKVPLFEIVKVRQDDESWETFGWGAPESVASRADITNGILYVYCNMDFPDYVKRYRAFFARSMGLGGAFELRYTIWLAVHSLLVHQDAELERKGAKKDAEGGVPIPSEVQEEMERVERIRHARIAIMMAAREAEELEARTIEG